MNLPETPERWAMELARTIPGINHFGSQAEIERLVSNIARALQSALAAITRERDDLLKASKYWSTQLEASMRDISERQKERDRYREALKLCAKDTDTHFGCKGCASALKERE